jgi:hypothetical protein
VEPLDDGGQKSVSAVLLFKKNAANGQFWTFLQYRGSKENCVASSQSIKRTTWDVGTWLESSVMGKTGASRRCCCLRRMLQMLDY